MRATLKDMARFQCSLTLKLVFVLHFQGPVLLNLPKSIIDFTQHQAPSLSLLNNTFNETSFRWVLWQSVQTAVNLNLSFSAYSDQEFKALLSLIFLSRLCRCAAGFTVCCGHAQIQMHKYRHISNIKQLKLLGLAMTTYFMCDRVNVLEEEAPIPDIAKQKSN